MKVYVALLKCSLFKTLSYINYELDLGGPGIGHSAASCDVGIMNLRVPRG